MGLRRDTTCRSFWHHSSRTWQRVSRPARRYIFIIILTLPRRPPPDPALLPHSRRKTTPPNKTLLRLRHLANNTTVLLIHHLALHPAYPRRVPQMLGSRLLLRHRRCTGRQPLAHDTGKEVATAQSQSSSKYQPPRPRPNEKQGDCQDGVRCGRYAGCTC